MEEGMSEQLADILAAYDSAVPEVSADDLQDLWLQTAPKSIEVIKAELRQKQETIGIPVPVLKSMGKQIGKAARGRVDEFLPLAKLLWSDYGREGRVVALIPLGVMELEAPQKILPLLLELCRTCLTWEDADRLAMDALEPIVRRDPGDWLGSLESWLDEDNKWVKRAAVTVVGRLPMKHPEFAPRCMGLIERLLHAHDVDVRKSVSFAIRLVARGDIAPVHEFLTQQIPPEDPAATWVLCDAIRSMTKSIMPEFVDLLPRYQEWAADPSVEAKDLRSIESAVNTLKRAKG